jgi:transposase
MRYTTDLTDTEWQFIHYCFPKPSPTGRPREHSYRELVNAMFYLTRTGCQWRNLPTDFAPWRTVYHYFRQWKNSGLWAEIHTHLREFLRQFEARNRHASAAIIDSQSVKSTECSDSRGYDAGKKVNGRKRHVLVDTLGLILMVLVVPANIQDRDAARQLLTRFYGAHRRRHVKHIWADGGYAGTRRIGDDHHVRRVGGGQSASAFDAGVGALDRPRLEKVEGLAPGHSLVRVHQDHPSGDLRLGHAPREGRAQLTRAENRDQVHACRDSSIGPRGAAFGPYRAAGAFSSSATLRSSRFEAPSA